MECNIWLNKKGNLIPEWLQGRGDVTSGETLFILKNNKSILMIPPDCHIIYMDDDVKGCLLFDNNDHDYFSQNAFIEALKEENFSILKEKHELMKHVQILGNFHTKFVKARKDKQSCLNSLETCWEEINKMIKSGDLLGDGLDKHAERNGFILAANTIEKLISATRKEILE